VLGLKHGYFLTLANLNRFENYFKTPFMDVLRDFGTFLLVVLNHTLENKLAWTLTHIRRLKSFKKAIKTYEVFISKQFAIFKTRHFKMGSYPTTSTSAFFCFKVF
jgi:hypothetical protein